MINALHYLAEERIKQAIAKGDMDDLDGKGKPLSFEDDSMVPEDLRMAFKLLRNSGHIPKEVQSKHEIVTLEQAIAHQKDEVVKLKQIKKLHFLVTQLGESTLGKCLLEDSPYYSRLVANQSRYI